MSQLPKCDVKENHQHQQHQSDNPPRQDGLFCDFSGLSYVISSGMTASLQQQGTTPHSMFQMPIFTTKTPRNSG